MYNPHMVTSQRQVDLPAVAGGNPVRDDFLSFSQPRLTNEEIDSVVDTLKSGWLTTAGKTHRFETDFASYVGSAHAVGLNSCTAGLFLSLKILDIKPGDEVITTPLTFPASVNVIEHLDATPVLADVHPVTGCIDPKEVESKITERTRALIPVHLYGRPCDMEALRSIADRNGFPVVQDCAHAIECELNDRNVATFGDLACYSFYATKNITTGEGGMVVTDNQEWADRIRVLALHGLDKTAYDRYSAGGRTAYDLTVPGYKFNMPDILASLGLEGLKRVDERHLRRVHIWNRYIDGLSGLPGLEFPGEPDLGTRHARHLFACLINPDEAGLDRDSMVDALAQENIGTGIHFTPVHHYSYYRDKYHYGPGDFPNASRIGLNVFSIPLTPYLSDSDVDDVINAVKKIILYFNRLK